MFKFQQLFDNRAVWIPIVAVLLLSSYNSCSGPLDSFKLGGTDAGNPDEDPVEFASDVTDILCEKLSACFSVQPTDCKDALLAARGLTEPLGLRPEDFEDLKAIQAGIESHQIILTLDSALACYSNLSSLSCGNALVQEAYSPAAPENIDGIFKFLVAAPACGQILLLRP